jgi:hypothetical protein
MSFIGLSPDIKNILRSFTIRSFKFERFFYTVRHSSLKISHFMPTDTNNRTRRIEDANGKRCHMEIRNESEFKSHERHQEIVSCHIENHTTN